MVRAEADDEGEEDEENDGVGLVAPPAPAGHGVPLGRGSQLQLDLGVAAQDDDERDAEGDDAGQQEEIGGGAGAVEGEVLHAGPSALALVQHAAEQQRRQLHRHQRPDQAADPTDQLHAAQALQLLRMHHDQITVQADAGHEPNA